MTESAFSTHELRELADAACNGALAESDLARLESLLYDNVEAQRFYLKRVSFDTRLHRTLAGAVREPAPVPKIVAAGHVGISSLQMLGHVCSGWPAAYLIATVVFAIASLIGAFTYVSSPTHLTDHLAATVERGPAPAAGAPSVGRITGMVDCVWEGARGRVQGSGGATQKSEIRNRKPLLCLGDRIALKSGLLEITYDTGAKVILQGPVAYEVESKNGGFLSIGKLTGRVEVEKAKGFAIRTPTAIVTDLGTEFGVDVDTSGGTTSHVFRGSVRVQPLPTNGDSAAQPIVLGASESARVNMGADRVQIMHQIPADHRGFVREVSQQSSRLLFCDTFGNQADSAGFADFGLSQCLLERQFGICRPVVYLRGGDFDTRKPLAQVGHPACPGKLSLFTDSGNAGWVVLNRLFRRDVVVSAEIDPVALRSLNQRAHVPETAIGDRHNENWMALGVRGWGFSFDHKELPLASDAGAVIRLRSNGRWDYFENGVPMVHGHVSPAHPYSVVMRVLGNQLEIAINGGVLDLDPNGTGTARTLRGQAAENKGNCISVGAGNVLAPAVSAGIDINVVDNLTITEASVGAFAGTVPTCPIVDPRASQRKETPDRHTVK